MGGWYVRIYWFPGHIEITEKDVADRLADLKANGRFEPFHLAVKPTLCFE